METGEGGVNTKHGDDHHQGREAEREMSIEMIIDDVEDGEEAVGTDSHFQRDRHGSMERVQDCPFTVNQQSNIKNSMKI